MGKKRKRKIKPLVHEKGFNFKPLPSLSTKKGPISCVAPYPTEEQPGPRRYINLISAANTVVEKGKSEITRNIQPQP